MDFSPQLLTLILTCLGHMGPISTGAQQSCPGERFFVSLSDKLEIVFPSSKYASQERLAISTFLRLKLQGRSLLSDTEGLKEASRVTQAENGHTKKREPYVMRSPCYLSWDPRPQFSLFLFIFNHIN